MKGILNPKQQMVLQYLLSGMSEHDALIKAGYKSTSRTLIVKIRPHYQKLLIEKQNQIIAETMSREECVAILKKIAKDDKNPRTQIQAIAQLSRICGYETIKTENINSNQVEVKFVEDIPPNAEN
jgi:hypothetical protein